MPPRVAYAATRMAGWFVRDVVLTWEEYLGLMDNLLVVDGPAAGPTRLTSGWAIIANRSGGTTRRSWRATTG